MEKRRKETRKWKKSIIFFSYFCSFLALLSSILIETPIETSHYDLILTKLFYFFGVSSIVIPIWVLLNKTLKSRLPFFKKKKWYTSLCGSFLLFFLLISFAFIVDEFHTEEYKNNFQEYWNVEKASKKSSLNKKQLEEQLENLESNEKKEANQNLEKEMKVHYLDVGQGDSIFLELPNEETMLIDAAESEKSLEIIEKIKNLGYSKIDYIIATHPHSDHIGGLARVIENFEIGSIYMPKAVSTSKTYENLLKTIQNKGLKVKKAIAGVQIINQENFKIEIIAPQDKTYKSLNNYSAVLKITYKNRTFLFMGDAEKESEQEINSEIKADVIKVAHHGSDTSSTQEFIEKVNPDYAIISVGKDNSYKHPNEIILNRYQKIGAKIYRTDEDGTILVKTDGENITVEAEKNQKEEKTETQEINNPKIVDLEKKDSNIQLIDFTSKITKGQNASITIKGEPNTNYKITVKYSSISNAKGLEPKTSDQNGYVSWNWKVGTSTKSGTYQIIISDGINSEEYLLIVE